MGHAEPASPIEAARQPAATVPERTRVVAAPAVLALGVLEGVAGGLQVVVGVVIRSSGFRHFGPAVLALGVPLALLGAVRTRAAIVVTRRTRASGGDASAGLCRVCERLGPVQVVLVAAFAAVAWCLQKADLGTGWALLSQTPIVAVMGVFGVVLSVALARRSRSRSVLGSRISVVGTILQIVFLSIAVVAWFSCVLIGFVMGAIGGALGNIH